MDITDAETIVVDIIDDSDIIEIALSRPSGKLRTIRPCGYNGLFHILKVWVKNQNKKFRISKTREEYGMLLF